MNNQIINPIPNGGAPIFAEDLLNIQENAKEGLNSFLEGIRSLNLSIKQYGAGGNLVNELQTGLFLTNPSYSNNGVGQTSTDVSECYVYLDGEILYFGGSSLNLSASASGLSGNLILLTKGDSLKTPRVFKDGFSKDILITHSLKLTASSYGAGGVFIPTELLGKQAVYLVGSEFGKGENHIFGLKNSLGIFLLENRVLNVETKQQKNVHTVQTVSNGTVEQQIRFILKDGIVQCRGKMSLTSLNDGTILFSLPTGFFSTNRSIRILCCVGTANFVMEIQGNGICILREEITGSGTFTGKILLDGFSYEV